MDRILELRRLKQILGKWGIVWVARKGKGSHGSFCKSTPQGVFSYPVPNERVVLICYVRGCRKKFKLTEQDGVSDKVFYDD